MLSVKLTDTRGQPEKTVKNEICRGSGEQGDGLDLGA